MERNSRRCLLGGALAAAFLAGCRSQSPFADTSDEFTAARSSDDASTARPHRVTEPPSKEPSQHELPVLDEGASLEEYLRYAALQNPGLEAKFQEWKAAVERLPQVSALPDPRFTYGYYVREIQTRSGPLQHSFALSQAFPWFGKLQDRKDAAARHANAAYLRFESARLDLLLNVEQAYNELYFLKRSIDITNENIELLQQFERVARARYRVAAAGHPDLIKIQVELGLMEDRLRQLRDLRDPYTARLNAVLDRPADAVVPWPQSVADREVDTAGDQWFALLRERNPELIAMQEEIEGERIASEIARKEGLPDLTVGVAYTVVGERSDMNVLDNGDDAVLATFSVNLPLWREKYKAGVREAVARRLAASSRRSEASNQLASELQEALFEHRDAKRRVELYRATLIPKAKESLQASLGGFEQGEVDFLDLIDTERTLLEFQVALERALVDRATSYARIERLVGAGSYDFDALSAPQEDAP